MAIGKYLKPASSAKEFLLCACLLPAIREKYHSSFSLLEIPEVIRIDECAGTHGTVFLREYDGQKFNDRWSEQPGARQWGGAALSTELTSEMVVLIEDFRKIEIDWLARGPVGQRIREASFHLQNWLTSFRDRWPAALGWGISQRQLECAEELVGQGFTLPGQVFSNGDFYPRNLIKTEQRIVLVDWAYWPGYRACFIDHLPNVVAFAVIHMWANRPWQAEFLRHAANTLGIGADDLRKAILIKSFEQAAFWHQGRPDLVGPQMELFKMALENRLPP